MTDVHELRLSIDPSLDQPIYRQLRAAIIDAITDGSLVPGDPVPSSRALAESLCVSRSTVNLTYQELVTEGYLVAEERVGYAVHPDLAPPDLAAGGNRIDWGRRLVDYDDYLPHLRKPPGRHSQAYPFVVGALDPALFPAADWQRAARLALSAEHVPAVIRDHIDTDDPMLVDGLCNEVLPARGIDASPDQVLVTMGTQHGLQLAAAALVRPGDRVGVENPGYPDAAHIFSRAGGELVPCPVDEQGVDIGSASLSLVVVTPGHQYPTNVTLSAARRGQLLARADLDDLVIIEDDHGSELRSRGRAAAALKSDDPSGRVVHLGSLSTCFGPGLRLGYAVADVALITKMRDLRRYSIRHPSGLTTRTMAIFIDQGGYAKGMRRVRAAVKERWDVAVAAVQRHLGWDVDPPAGGASLWLPGPDDLDVTSVIERAGRAGIFVESGASCYLTDPVPNNVFRLGLSGIPTADIEPGIERLAAIVDEERRARG